MPEDSDLQTISISGFPRELLSELEALAAKERRTRSNYIVKTLADAVREARPLVAKRPKSKAA